MSPETIERLTLLAQRAGITELDLTDEGTVLRLRIAAETAPAQTAAAASTVLSPGPQPKPRVVRAPGVGLFRPRHPLTGRAAVDQGVSVRPGQIVGYLQAGPCLRAVTAAEEGVIGPALVADGGLVGFGTPLYPLS